MKYVYAALVAVSLVACGGTEEGALGPKEARSGAVLCDGIPKPDGTACPKSWLLGTWCGPDGVQITITPDGNGVVTRVGDSNSCWGDLNSTVFTDLTATNSTDGTSAVAGIGTWANKPGCIPSTNPINIYYQYYQQGSWFGAFGFAFNRC